MFLPLFLDKGDAIIGNIPIKQPDGKWCLYSTIVEDFLLEDATQEEIEEHLVEQIREEINSWLDEIADEDKPRLRYEDAVKRAERHHSST